jgi:hypothetical protein
MERMFNMVYERAMGNLKSCFIVATLALAACGSDHKANPDAPVVLIDAPVDTLPPVDAPPDAPAYDFSCLGQALPTTGNATDTITLAAQELSVNGVTPNVAADANATADLDMCKVGTNCAGQNHLTDTLTTDSTGGGTFTVNAGSVAINGFVKITKTGDRPNYTYLPAPIGKDQLVPALAMTTDGFTFLNSALQGGQQAGNGNLALLVTDCANTPISDSANITLSVKQGGQDVTGTNTVDLGSLASQAAGSYIVFNVPPGSTDITATYMGMQMLTVTADVVADASTETELRPGPLP